MARSVEKTTTVTISREIHHRFKVLCAQLRVSQKSVIDELVEEWMNSILYSRPALEEKES